MCGICGIVHRDLERPVDRDELTRMNHALAHRGPDGEGLHIQEGVGLGHRRLAIVDPSPAGAQPMSTRDGRLHLSYNGEIYNHSQYRPALEAAGYRFRGTSDTETLLYLWAEHGRSCLPMLRGMFAFAVWDAAGSELTLVRDRFGQKPLYYRVTPDRLDFASEIKALMCTDGARPEPDPAAIHHFLSFDYVPGPGTAFQGIRKLPAAHTLTLARGREPSVEPYWQLSYAPRSRRPSVHEAAEEVADGLRESVRLRLMSDVPLGLLLSGGVDSAALLALLRDVDSGPIQTFTVGFPGQKADESAAARATADAFGTEHHEFRVEPDVVSTLPAVVEHFDDLFGDPSAIPSWHLAQQTGRHVKVAIGGDGGDELFAGYNRYKKDRLASAVWNLPMPLRVAAVTASKALIPRALPPYSMLRRVRRFFETGLEPPQRLYPRWLLHFDDTQKADLYTPEFRRRVTGEETSADLLRAALGASTGAGTLNASLDVDTRTYLPDDILYKVDIATMAHSLEGRSPFLDHELAQTVASLPPDMKLRRLTSKWILRRALRAKLPADALRRPKKGFGLPIGGWLAGDLSELLNDTLLSVRASQRGYFERSTVERLIAEHRSGRGKWQYHLWNLLVVELWHRAHVDGARSCDG